MPSTAASQAVQTLEIRREQMIAAPLEVVFQALLDHLGPAGEMPGGKPFPMTLEAWPGGRWFRDLGNKAGHLWGHVQVIKPPTLLELCGPMPMSYAATNHVQYRLVPEGNGTLLRIVHTAIGLIPDEHRDGMPQGWESGLQQVRDLAEKRNAKRP